MAVWAETTIAKRIAEIAADKKLLIATFFFSKSSPSRSTKDRLALSIPHPDTNRGRDRAGSSYLLQKHSNAN
jgi:hypothetical protein